MSNGPERHMRVSEFANRSGYAIMTVRKKMYTGKFTHVFVVSPSAHKMELEKLKEENINDSFDLDWIFDKIDQVNNEETIKKGMKNKDVMFAAGKS